MFIIYEEDEASMMPTVGARVDSSKDYMGENHEGEGTSPNESDSDMDQAPADVLDKDGCVKCKTYGGGYGMWNSSFTLIIIIYLNFL